MFKTVSNLALLSKFLVNSLPYSSNLPSCNDVPKQLLGHFEPDQEYLSDEELRSQEFSKSLDENGCYTPEDCVPEEKLLVVVPYRDRAKHLRASFGNQNKKNPG